MRGKSLDLAKEVLGGESTLAEPVGQRVGGCRETNARLDESAEQGGHQYGVPRIVQFEFVDAHQSAVGQCRHRGRESHRAHKVGELHEGAVGLGVRGGMPQRRQQMRLADTEATVEIHPGTFLRWCRPSPPTPGPVRLVQPIGEGLQPRHRRRLGWFGRVRSIGVEGHRREVRRRHQLPHDALDRNLGTAIDETLRHVADATRDTMGDVRLVFPEAAALPAGAEGDAELERLYPWPATDTWVRANMVVTVDGRSEAPGGLTEAISSVDDKRVFARLRSTADVVVVGAGTVRREGYRPLRARAEDRDRRLSRGQTPAARLAIVSRNLDLDPLSDIFQVPRQDSDVARPVILCPAAAPADRRESLASLADVVTCGDAEVDLETAIGDLRDRGMTRILCEGGPQLLTALVDAGLVDEFDVSISPMLLAGDGGGMLAPSDRPAQPRSMTLHHVIAAESMLMLRYVLHR